MEQDVFRADEGRAVEGVGPVTQYLDVTDEEMASDLNDVLFPERRNLYAGPGARTANQLLAEFGWGKSKRGLIVNRADAAVARGELVRVNVMAEKDGPGGCKIPYAAIAWVKASVYDEWQKRKREG